MIGNSTTRGYKFTYDGLNRMLNAVYGEGDNLSSGIGRFSENVTEYDRNGNIKSLQRSGRTSASAYGLVDNLTLQYSGNQLINVSDAASDPLYSGAFNFVDGNKGTVTEYIYDSNGNLQQDFNKNIANIQHNMLNLPSVLQFSNGNRKDYQYSADGIKRRVTHQTAIANISVPMGQLKDLSSGQVSQTYTVDYCGNVIYENGSLSKILTEEGYVTFSGGTPTYHYYLKDHQGNNRMVVHPNGASWITEQENHYYPFGGVFEVNTVNSGIQGYKYNGKELDRMHGLDWYDYGARHYDAALGRFTRMDRFAEKYFSMSIYQYGANNPVQNIDLNGDSIFVLNHGEGIHLAMLIQNDVGKWQYFSVNGNNVYISGQFTGGRKFDDIAVGDFNSPQDFLNSSYNSIGNEDDISINGYGYSEGYAIPTTKEQDGIIRRTFIKISQNEEYNLLWNNCCTTVQRSMESVGIKTYDKNERTYRVPDNRILGESSFTVTHGNARPFIPKYAFQSIVKNNPGGILIYRNRKDLK